MEHHRHFGLARDPFRNEPQPEFWFASSRHEEAARRLRRCVEQGKELCLLIGEVGSGTTSLVRAIFEDLEPDRFEVALLVPLRGVGADGLRSAIARQLGVEEPAKDATDAVRQLFARLIALRDAGRRAVVGIDEAHTLGPEALGELRALLNLEHDDERLLSLVLVGPPSLEVALGREPGLLARVELRVPLEPLAAEDAYAYLAHRLELAGGDPKLFDEDVADAMVAIAGGLPRRLNALADNVLFEAHCAGRECPTRTDVERAARDLPWATPRETAPPAAPGPAPRSPLDTDHGLDAPLGASPALDSLRRAPAAAAELDLPDAESEGPDDLAHEIERTLAAGRARRAHRAGPAAPDLTTRVFEKTPVVEEAPAEPEIDAALISPEDTAPGAWHTAEPLVDEDDTAQSRRGPSPGPRATGQAPPPAGPIAGPVRHGAPAAAAAAEERPLPTDEDLDDLFVDLVDEVGPEG